MHSFSISQPVDGTCSLLLLPETTSIFVFSFNRDSRMVIKFTSITESCLAKYRIGFSWGPLRGVTYVPSLNFKTCCFAYWGGSHVGIFIIVFALFLVLSQFQPIFVSFVAFSAVLCCCYLKRAFFIAHWPSPKIRQPVFPDNFMGPKMLINCVFKRLICIDHIVLFY